LTPLEVKLTKQTTLEEMNCVQSELLIRVATKDGREFPVTHLLYTSWPDFGVPENPGSLLRFIRHAEEVNNRGDRTREHGQSPMIVGCSAGVGRTGSFIALYSLLQAVQMLDRKSPTSLSEFPASPISNPALGSYSEDPVVAEIDWLREQRGGMVQKREQMELIYRVLLEA